MNQPYHDFMYDILLFTSLVSIIGVSVMAYGYRASLYSTNKITRLFARSITLLALGYVLRRLMWDVVMPIMGGEIFYEPMNIAFNLINMFAVYFGLQARLCLIPLPERHNWHWYSAWMHPGLFRIRIPLSDGGSNGEEK